MSKTLDTVLLFALPASGKSELRRYLASLSPERCRDEFHMGQTLQLDDYPYVHLMHRIDDELKARGQEYVFYKGPVRPFRDNFEWGTLIHLLNEDYAHLMAGTQHAPASAGAWMLNRLDEAHAQAGLERELAEVPHRVWVEVAAAIEEECQAEVKRLNEVNAQEKEGKTIVIEAARGGPNGATFPLTPPHGYQYSISQLSDEILDRASVLYIWVTPEESRRKNIERGRPDGQGSILFHCVPMEVMLGEYGLDDMGYLIEQSGKPDTIRIERIGEETNDAGERRYVEKVWHLPVARFDNRSDLTTFVREDPSTWDPADVEAIDTELKQAMAKLAAHTSQDS
jgi:hypothetical protein